MKKWLSLMMCVLLFVCLTACKPQQKAKEVLEWSGTVTAVSGSVITVKSPEGEEFSFDIKDSQKAPLDYEPGTGDSVTLEYLPPLQDSAVVQKVIGVKHATQTQSPAAQPTGQPVHHAVHTQSAQDVLDTMTLDEKIGQLFFVRCPESGAVEDIGKYHLGGYILFARDFEGKDKDQVKNTIAGYQNASKTPMLIGVDEEGGTVNRVSKYPAFRAAPFHSPQALYKAGGFPMIQKDTKEKAGLLRSLGINVNFAPVCDVSTNSADYIYPRAFGQDAENTAKYVGTVVGEMKAESMGSVLKHFPGYGPNKDTHVGFSQDDRSFESFQQNDFKPFEAGIQAGADSILVCHNVVKCLDESDPASLSKEWHSVIRKELGFDGVVMTDDLVMNAVKEEYGAEKSAVMAVLAGNDILLSTEYPQQIEAVKQAVKKGEITESQINRSVLRILKWKFSLGLFS